eukprot:Skav231926  [mRNA]  locus=scaffold2322:129876:133174:- [translate_table: standard]
MHRSTVGAKLCQAHTKALRSRAKSSRVEELSVWVKATDRSDQSRELNVITVFSTKRDMAEVEDEAAQVLAQSRRGAAGAAGAQQKSWDLRWLGAGGALVGAWERLRAPGPGSGLEPPGVAEPNVKQRFMWGSFSEAMELWLSFGLVWGIKRKNLGISQASSGT